MPITFSEMLLRVAVGTILCAAIGFEREERGRVAGLRTHLLVALASTVVMLVSTQYSFYQHYPKDGSVTVDPSHIASSVLTGVGFLGAGAIMRTGLTVHGLTTGAGLLVAAAVGLAAGGGMFLDAVIATVIAVFALCAIRFFEKPAPPAHDWFLTLRADRDVRREVVQKLKALNINAAPMAIDGASKQKSLRLSYSIHFEDSTNPDDIFEALKEFPSISHIKVRRAKMH